LLRALASLGLLNETPGRRFNLTERGAVLRTDAPRSLRYMAMLEGGPEHWAIWKHVPAMVRDGRQNAFMREYGKMAFDHARANPDGYGAAHLRCVAQFQHGGDAIRFHIVAPITQSTNWFSPYPCSSLLVFSPEATARTFC